MLIFLHKTHKLIIIRRETPDKSQLQSGDSLQTALSLLFNTVKVFKKAKVFSETVNDHHEQQKDEHENVKEDIKIMKSGGGKE